MPTPQKEYRIIPLTQGQFTVVDADDFEVLSQWKWFAHWSPCTRSFYAGRNGYRDDGKRTTFWMHRHILNLDHGNPLHADHINHQTLVSHAENALRKIKHVTNKSGFRGVYQQGGVFEAAIRIGKKRVSLGCRKSAQEAHELYREAALRLHRINP